MKRTAVMCALAALATVAGCRKDGDKVVAMAYHHKLYLSEVRGNMPIGLNTRDSIDLAEEYISYWIREQLILHEARKNLPLKEKNFDKELDEYRNSLMVKAYCDRLTAGMPAVGITDKQIKSFNANLDRNYAVDKSIVRVNYAKLPRGSRAVAPVRDILFDETQRQSRKEDIVKMLNDTVEYFLDDDAWFYLTDLSGSMPFDFTAGDTAGGLPLCAERDDGEYHYLFVLLDYKDKRSVAETEEELAAVRMMILQQNKKQYIDRHVSRLYDEALKSGAVVR